MVMAKNELWKVRRTRLSCGRSLQKGIVLLKNEGDVLSLNPQNLKKVAIVGGNAKAIVLSSGGSASLKASYSPCDGIVNALAPYGVVVTYSEVGFHC